MQMYKIVQQKQESKQKILQLSNRINHLQRQEVSIRRSYKIHK